MTASRTDIKVMVEERLRKLEWDPANVQIVFKEISDSSQSLEHQDEEELSLNPPP